MRNLYLELSKIDKENRALRVKGDQGLRNAILGDKELLELLLNISPKISNKVNIVKFSTLICQLSNFKDPGYLKLEEDMWEWLKDVLNHDAYGREFINEKGIIESVFSPMLKRKIGEFLIKIDDVKQTLVQS